MLGALLLLLLNAATASAGTRSLDSEALYKELLKQVVWIETSDRIGRPAAQGSGIVLGRSLSSSTIQSFDERYSHANSDGIDVLSNFHVVAFAGEITIRANTGEQALAAVVFCDAERDLTILRTVRKLPVEPVAFSTSYKVGQRVYALGSPKGLGWTFSDGIISGIRQEVGRQFVQTTAPMSPGSSGGGLFNDQGKLIGLTTFQASEGQNLNFALELGTMASELNDLRKGNCVRPLGVDHEEWVVGAIRRMSDGSSEWRPIHPKWRAWKECNDAIAALEPGKPEIFSSGWKDWRKRRSSAFSHRFSLFNRDTEGLIEALEGTTEGKAREKLLQVASPSAKSQLSFELYLLQEAALGDAESFGQVFIDIVESLPQKPSQPNLRPVEVDVEVNRASRDFRYYLELLKQRPSQAENAVEVEDSLRKNGWL